MTSNSLATRPRLWHIVVLAMVYITSRAAAHLAGLHFDAAEVSTYWQFLDTELLRHHLFQSLFYLHAQPPLMNAFFGVLMKLFPVAWPSVAYLLYCTAGLFAWLAIFSIAIRNGVSLRVALAFVLLAMCNPSALLYEAQPLYTHVVFCLLVFAAFFFDRYLQSRSLLPASALLATLTILVLWRSSFQPAWFLFLAIWIVYLTPRHNLLRVASAATVCVIFIAAPVLKNGLAVGSFNTSSWSGMSVAKAWTWSIHPEIPPLVAKGKLSPISAIQSFRPVGDYQSLIPTRTPTGIPALDELTRQNGITNYNNAAYVDISKAYFRDYWRVWRYSPRTMLAFSIQVWIDFLKPASQYVATYDPANENILEPLDRGYRAVFCCRTLPIHSSVSATDNFRQRLSHAFRSLCWGSVAITAIFFAMLLYPPLIRWAADGSQHTRLLFYFLIVTFAYNALLTSMLEEGENMRFRYETHGLVLIAALILLDRCIKTSRSISARPPTAT